MLQPAVTLDIQRFIETHLYLREDGHSTLMDLDDKFGVRIAKTQEDFKKVFDVRWKTYKRFFNRKDDVIDIYDFEPSTIQLLVQDEKKNIVGSLRILDRRHGKIELDQFIEINSLLSRDEMPCAEANRISIPKHQHMGIIRFLLYKGFYLYCINKRINTMLISLRRITARNYQYFYFKNLGLPGIFHHPHLGNLEYHTYKCNISETSKFLKILNFKLYDFFCIKEHPNINVK